MSGLPADELTLVPLILAEQCSVQLRADNDILEWLWRKGGER